MSQSPISWAAGAMLVLPPRLAEHSVVSVGVQIGSPWGGLPRGVLQGRQLSAGGAWGRRDRPSGVHPRHQRFRCFQDVGDSQRLRQPCSKAHLLSASSNSTVGADACRLHAKSAIQCRFGPCHSMTTVQLTRDYHLHDTASGWNHA